MGKVGGFLEFDRKDPEYRAKHERVKDFNQVAKRLSNDAIVKQAARCMECGTPFCHTSGCPVENIIPEFNDMVYRGRWKDALDILLSTCNFPEFTGRLCPAPCEAACVLGINDDPVTIRQVELSIIEKAYESGYMKPSPPSSRYEEKVAVVGSGPCGLAVADSLNKHGYNVVVYDNALQPGGILRYGIPDFKMEKWVVDRRIDLMRTEGIEFELGVTVGQDISFNYLRDRFDGICLSAGAKAPRDLPAPGRELKGIYFAMDYLVRQNKKNAGEPIQGDIDVRGKKVVVIGGGDTGSDCIGTALRQGATQVCQIEIMPRPPDERDESTPWPLWPYKLRTSSSHLEGADRRWSVATKEFVGKDGKLKGLRCVEVGFAKDSDGRLQFPEKDGSEFILDADFVFLAMGFIGQGKSKLVENFGIELDLRGNINVDDMSSTNLQGVFAAGDMARGQSLIVRAMADGRRTAMNISDYFRKKRDHSSQLKEESK